MLSLPGGLPISALRVGRVRAFISRLRSLRAKSRSGQGTAVVARPSRGHHLRIAFAFQFQRQFGAARLHDPAAGEHMDIVRLHIVEQALIRSEEHTSELQSLMRNSYAVFC